MTGHGSMALPSFGSSGTGLARGEQRQALLRMLAPAVLIPAGAIYCQIFEIFFGPERSTIWGSLVWAVATLSPWVIGAMLFEASVRPGEPRIAIVRRVVLLAIIAYMASAVAALLLGGDGYRAFYSRLPLIAAALLVGILYQVPVAEQPAMVTLDPESPPIAPAQIVLASAAGNYVELHFGGRSTVWRQTMQNAEKILERDGFVRVHRSYIVPRHAIETVRSGRKGPVEVALRDGRSLPVSHRYASNLRH
jgi:hypothetical protein